PTAALGQRLALARGELPSQEVQRTRCRTRRVGPSAPKPLRRGRRSVSHPTRSRAGTVPAFSGQIGFFAGRFGILLRSRLRRVPFGTLRTCAAFGLDTRVVLSKFESPPLRSQFIGDRFEILSRVVDRRLRHGAGSIGYGRHPHFLGVLAIVVDRTARPGGIRGSLRHAPTGSTSAERHVGAVANPRCCRTKASGSGAAHTQPRWETRLAIREERLCARVAPGAGGGRREARSS